MNFKAVEIILPSNKVDLLSGKLYSFGTLGIIEEANHENNTKVTAYFTKIDKDLEKKLNLSVKSFNGTMTVKKIKQENWANDWKQNFPPLEIVPNVNIVPSWIKRKPNSKTIVLDPGIAFGTGAHPTTQMCARAIYDSLHVSRSTFHSLLDVGCGSGILGLTASRLGIKNITSVDNDEDARITAKENFKFNNVKTRILKTIPTNKKYDIVVSNILLNPLLEMHKTIVNSVNRSGYLILSGFTDEQKNDILEKYKLNLFKSYESGEWVAITFRK